MTGWLATVLMMLPVVAASLASPAWTEPLLTRSYSWAAPSCFDGSTPHWYCAMAETALLQQGRVPWEPHPYDDCADGCVSNLQALVNLARCESGFDVTAYDEGWVGLDFDGNRVWNRSRGILQIGDGWGHILSDAEAARPWPSLLWVAEHPRRSSRFAYPECARKIGA